MRSAGDPNQAKIKKSVDNQTDIMCGLKYGAEFEVPGCKSKGRAATDAALSQLEPGKQQEAFSNHYKLGGQTMYALCQQDVQKQNPRVDWNAITDADVRALAKCTSAYILTNKPLRFRFDDRPFVETAGGVIGFIPHAVDLAKMGGYVPEDIPIPQSLRDKIKELRAMGMDDVANLAKRLFYHGLGNVEPKSEWDLAAQSIADQVDKYIDDKITKAKDLPKPVQDAMLEYYKAKKDKDKAKQKAAAKKIADAMKKDKKLQAKLAGTYVVPKATDKAKKYKIDIKEDKKLQDILDKYPAKLWPQISRLYGEARQKAPKADSNSVGDALDKAIRDKLGDEKDPEKMLTQLRGLKVDSVKTDESGKKAEEVALKELKTPKAPQALYDAFDAGTPARQYLLNFIWGQIKQNLTDNGVEKIDSALEGKIIKSLKQPKSKGGLGELSAQDSDDKKERMNLAELAAQQVIGVDKVSGKVSLKQVPQEAYGTITPLAEVSIALGHGQLAYAMMHQKISEIYIQAKKADPKINPKPLATKVDKAVRNNTDPDKMDETNGVIVVRNFLGMEFDKFDENGDIILKYEKGYNPQGTGGGNKGVVPIDEDSGMEFYTDDRFEVAPMFGLKDIEGEYPDVMLGGAANLYIDYNYKDRFKVGFFTGVDAVYTMPLYRAGIRDLSSADTEFDDGAAYHVRLGQLGLRTKYKWGVKDDGSLDSVTFALGARGGIIGAGMGNGLELALTPMRDPVNNSFPFGPSTRTLGIAVPLTLGIEPVTGAFGSNKEEHEGVDFTLTPIFGTAVGNLSSKEIYFGGVRGGFEASVLIDGGGLAGTEAVDWKLYPAFSLQYTSGDREEDDGTVITDAYTGLHFNAGGSFFIQPHENVQLVLGGTYGHMDTELDGLTNGYIVGGGALFPFVIGEEGPLTLIPQVFLAGSHVSREKEVAGGGDGGENPGCEPGYTCEDPSIGVGSGGVSAIPSEYQTWDLGHDAIVFNALMGATFKSLPGFTPYLGLMIMDVSDHQAGNNDTLGAFRLGANYKQRF